METNNVETNNVETNEVVETTEPKSFEDCVVRDVDGTISVEDSLVKLKGYLNSLVEREAATAVNMFELANHVFEHNRSQPLPTGYTITQMAIAGEIDPTNWVDFEKNALAFLQNSPHFVIAKGRSVGGVWKTPDYDAYKLELSSKNNKNKKKGNNK